MTKRKQAMWWQGQGEVDISTVQLLYDYVHQIPNLEWLSIHHNVRNLCTLSACPKSKELQ